MEPENSDPSDERAEAADQSDETPPLAAPRWFFAIFAGVLVLVTAMLLESVDIVTARRGGSTMEKWRILFRAWMQCQFGLLSLWVALGGGRAWIRAASVGALGTLAILGIGLNLYRSGIGSAMIYVHVAAAENILIVAAVALPLGWMRWTNRVRMTGSTLSAPPRQRQDMQFTLAQLMLTIGLICAAFGILPRLGDFGWSATSAISVAVVMYAALWTALGVGRPEHRFAVMLVVAAVVGPCLSLIQLTMLKRYMPEMQISLESVLDLAFNFGVGVRILIDAVLLAAILSVVRHYGYRLEWLDRSEANRSQSSAAYGEDVPGS